MSSILFATMLNVHRFQKRTDFCPTTQLFLPLHRRVWVSNDRTHKFGVVGGMVVRETSNTRNPAIANTIMQPYKVKTELYLKELPKILENQYYPIKSKYWNWFLQRGQQLFIIFCHGGSFDRAWMPFIFTTSQFRHCLIGLTETFKVLIVFSFTCTNRDSWNSISESMIRPFKKALLYSPWTHFWHLINIFQIEWICSFVLADNLRTGRDQQSLAIYCPCW